MKIISATTSPNIFEIFTLEPKKEIKDYKINELESINYRDRLLKASSVRDKLLEDSDLEIDLILLTSFFRSYYDDDSVHSIETCSSLSNKQYDILYKKILLKYLSGEFSVSPVKIIRGSGLIERTADSPNYLLITEKYKTCEDMSCSWKMHMKNILRLTEKLFLLQLIESRKFKSIVDIDIDEQLSLFYIKESIKVDLTNLIQLSELNLIGNISIPEINKNAELGNKVLSRIKS